MRSDNKVHSPQLGRYGSTGKQLRNRQLNLAQSVTAKCKKEDRAT